METTLSYLQLVRFLRLGHEYEKNGFTLIESILVLFIVSIMSFVLIINIVPIYNQKVIDTFLHQFEKDMMYAQQYAIVNKQATTILFVPTEYRYTVGENRITLPLLQREYNDEITIQATNFSNRVVFNGNGSIRKGGTIHISYKNQTYKVVYYLGKGRFDIQKL